MGNVTLTVVAETDAGPMGALGWFDRVCAAWPVGMAAPSHRVLTLDALMERVRGNGTDAAGLALAPVLVVVPPDRPGKFLYHLVDGLQNALLPAVIVVPRADAAAKRLQGNGVIIADPATPMETIAAMLLALGERQSAIADLKRELSIHTRTEAGMHGEIDRMHDELNLAATVQREMLPRRLPRLHGLQLAALFRPASYVSGDIYDAVQLDEEHVGFFIADAVGHGVPAALMTMVIAQSLHMTHQSDVTGRREIVSPADAMTRLNDEMCRWQRENSPRFTTAIYGVIHAPTRRVRMVGAGHPPPLRIACTPGKGPASMSRVDTDGPLLGVFPGEKYQEIEFSLHPGETLLLYSDGFETAFAPPELSAPASAHRRRAADSYIDEMSRLPWPSLGAADTSPTQALAVLARRIDEQSGSLHQIDDVTALAISACEAAAMSADDGFLAGLRAA